MTAGAVPLAFVAGVLSILAVRAPDPSHCAVARPNCKVYRGIAALTITVGTA